VSLNDDDPAEAKNHLSIQVVAVGIAVLSAALGLGQLAGGGLPGVVVLLVFLLAAWLAYLGYRSRSGTRTWVLYAGTSIFVLAGLSLTIHPVGKTEGTTQSVVVKPAPPAISISAERQVRWCESQFVLPVTAASELPPPVLSVDPNSDDSKWAAWGLHNKAVDADSTYVLLNVSSNDYRVITLTRLSIVVTQRGVPKGVVVDHQCGGPSEGRYIMYNLDTQPPKVIGSSGTKKSIGLKVTPLTFPYTVTDKDTATILLIGNTYECDCLWYAELSWQAGAAHGVQKIDLNGKPFHTEGTNGLRSAFFSSGKWETGGPMPSRSPFESGTGSAGGGVD
jgi:hypothetical protein